MRIRYLFKLAVISAIVVLLSGCSCLPLTKKENANEFTDVSEIKGEYEKKYLHKEIVNIRKEVSNHLLFSSFQCLIWEDQGVFTVTLARDGRVSDCLALFSAHGELIYQTGISLVSLDDISSLIGMKEASIVAEYGEFHFDSGSGVYLPSYITSDCRLLVFGIEDNSVFNITEYRFAEGSKHLYGSEFPSFYEHRHSP